MISKFGLIRAFTSLQMEELERKCLNEMQPGSVVAACRFPFPSLQHDRTIGEGIDSVWLYSVKGTGGH